MQGLLRISAFFIIKYFIGRAQTIKADEIGFLDHPDLFETVPGAVSADRQGCSCADSVPLRKQEDCVHF